MSKVNAAFKRYVILTIVHLFNFLPIKKNKIFLFSYYGSQYGCSPKYITEYILENEPPKKFDLVWAFNDPKSKQIDGIRKVKTMSLRYFYELCTSKVIITNFRTTDFFVKRKNQYYIQTWHSSLRLKQIEKDTEDTLPPDYIQMARKDSFKCDLLLSGCSYSTEIFKRAFWYEGEIFEHGIPRNDLLMRENLVLKERILAELNITGNKKIVLYAPTFRNDTNLTLYHLNFTQIRAALSKRFGGDWVFLVKLHPHLQSKSRQIVRGVHVMDVTSYDDIQELLSITDLLITDYSSLMFDYAITKKPCMLYVPDLNNYVQRERGLYFKLEKLPFIHAQNQEELLRKIEEFDSKKYIEKLNEFHKSIGTFEDGSASANLVNHINEICFGKEEGVINEAA